MANFNEIRNANLGTLAYRFKAALLICASLLLTGAPGASSARDVERTRVQVAGLAMAGQFTQLQSLMPIASELILNDKAFEQKVMNRIVDAVAAVDASHPTLHFVSGSQQALAQGDDSYSLGFVLAGEATSTLMVENLTEATFELQALVLVGNVSKDPMRQRVVSSYPIRMRHRTVLPEGHRLTREDAVKVYRSMLLGDRLDGVGDLVAEWQSRLSTIQLRENEVWISVAPLRITPEAQKQAGLTSDQVAAISFRATSLLEANLSRAADIPLVPFSFDGALEELTLHFSTRGIVAFRKPDPSYVLEVSAYGLRSAVAEEAMNREKKFAVSYGGGFLIEYAAVAPDKRKTNELSMRLKTVQTISYIGANREARRLDNAAMYAGLVMNFSDQLSRNLVPANEKWLAGAKADSEASSVQDLVRLAQNKLPAPKRGY